MSQRVSVAGRAAAPLRERIGIMQGRLVPSTTGELDCSPGPQWRAEFTLAGEIGLGHIELVADRRFDAANPIWSSAGRDELRRAATASSVGIPSLCVNEPLAVRLDETDDLAALIDRVTEVVADLPIRIVVLPLLEASDLSQLDWSSAARCVDRFAAALRSAGARLSLELSLPAPEGLQFLSLTTEGAAGICYDLGNATAMGFDVDAEITELGEQIVHVHAKDKNDAGENVEFGTGNTRFDRGLSRLADLGYDGLLTMEATRGAEPVATARAHQEYLIALDTAGPVTEPSDA